jgi:hypothetical protein
MYKNRNKEGRIRKKIIPNPDLGSRGAKCTGSATLLEKNIKPYKVRTRKIEYLNLIFHCSGLGTATIYFL